MTITAKVRKRMIENGRLVHAIVQGESNATTILFRIEGETDLVAEETLFLYLLYKRPNDQTVQLPILLDYTIEDGVILATFTPGAYFTADAGPVEISVIATSSAAELGGSGEVTNTLLWSSFPAWLLVAPSQLADSSTIIEENVFTQYLAELEALDADAKDYASDAEEYAKGTRSDGGTVTHATDNAKYYKNLAKDWAMKTGGPVEGVEMSAKVYAASSQNYATESQQWANKMDGKVLGTDYSAKYYAGEASDSAYAAGQSAESAAASAQIVEDHAEAIEAIADDLTNIDSVAGKLTEIGTVAGDLANIDAVAGNKTNIDAVNANKTNIDTVAGKATEITTVAGKANDVTTVAGIASDVTKVAAVDDDVSAVAAIDSDVSAVAAVASDVTAVSGALSDISDVATDLNDDDSAIRAVAADMTGVSAVAADLDNIDAVAADLANIDAADEHALEAEGWAAGTQNGVPVTSGSPYYENNAKYWADAVPDLKSAIDFNRKRIENLEQKSGSVVDVDYPEYSVYGEVPTGKAKNAIVSKLRGVTVAYNNGVTNGNFVNNTDGWTINGTLSVSGNVGTFTPSWTGAQLKNSCAYLANNHYHLITFRAKATGSPFNCSAPTTGVTWVIPTSVATLTTYAKIVQSTEARNLFFYVDGSASGASLELADVESHDLTQDFGPSVAGYLYSIEQATTGAGVALFKALVSAQDNSYETGELVSTIYESVGFLSKNLIKMKTSSETKNGIVCTVNDDGTINLSGTATANTTLALVANTSEMTELFKKGGTFRLSYHNGTFNATNFNVAIQYTNNGTTYYMAGANAYTVPKDSTFLYGILYIASGVTVSSVSHFALQLEVGSTETSFVPYQHNTLPLPASVTLRGILKVVNNALVVDGDEYDPETGDIDRNYVIVTFDGSDDEGWYKSSNIFISNGIDVSDAYSTDWWTSSLAVSNLLSRGVCVDYNTYSNLPFALTMVSGKIRLHISECENMTEAEFKTWLSNNNIQLLYKKATPTSDTPVDPINDPTLATEGGGTLSTTQTNDPAIVSAMEMTYMTL